MKQDDNELYEFNTHAFVIKIWLEDNLRWRGHITHVLSGERRYIEKLSEIDDFISLYLEKIGIQHGTLEQLYRTLKRKLMRSVRREGSHHDPEKNSGERE